MKCKVCKATMPKKTKVCPECGFTVKKKPLLLRPGCLIPTIIILLLAVAAGALFILDDYGSESSRHSHRKANKVTSFNRIIERIPAPTDSDEPTPTPTDIPEAEPTEVPVDGAYRTIMVYMIGSNLESDNGLGSSDISEMLSADLGDNTNLIIQTGGAASWVNSSIDDGEVNRFEVVNGSLNKVMDLGVLSMVEKSTLVDFITYSAENYPAENYTLVMYNHGGGVPISFGYDEIFDGALTDVDLGDALHDADVHFDALIFNACDMCSLELLMAVKDNTDYVVASERTLYGYSIYGAGIDYESWLPMAADPDEDIETICNQIADDYLDFLTAINCPGSMSVIKSSEVQGVYDAYVSYITDIYNNFSSETYANYMNARKDSLTYEGTDSVDIYTLAENFSTPYTVALQDAVDSAVVRVASTLDTDLGITAYSIYDHFEYYTEGRNSLVELGYDSNIINFYDMIASRIYYYAGMEQFAGDWYILPDDLTTTYLQELSLDSIEDNGVYTIPLDDEMLYTISSVEMWFIYDTNSPRMRYVYGTDRQCQLDSNNNITVGAPQYWLHVNGFVPTTVLAERVHTQGGGFFQVNLVYALVNGEEALLRLESGTDNVPGQFVGYYPTNFATLSIEEDIRSFEDTDEIQLAVTAVDPTGSLSYPTYDTVISASDLDPQWLATNVDQSQGEIVVTYIITDIYGNRYTSEFFHLG